MDVSLDETSVCIVDEAGTYVTEGKVTSDPAVLADYLQATGLSFVRVGLEACPLSQWIYSGLADAGFPVVCVEVRRVKAALAAMINKTDRNDARGIAQMMRTGWFQSVHVKTNESHELRFLLVARKLLLKQQYELENSIRGSLKVFGLKVGTVTRRMFEPRVRELVDGRPSLIAIVDPLLRSRALLITEHNRLYRMIVRAAQGDAACRRLMSVPGVGALVALTYRTGIDVPARFVRSKSVGAHFGLTPRKHQSGELDRTGHISKVGDEMVRSALYEAANVMMSRVVKWSALKAWAMRVAKRQGLKKAKVALARKLAVILHRIWVDGTSFRWSDSAPAVA
ncbi:IS110 family transposase [Chelativorans sp. M5D2P16]|uniref:IS110 family transposase n=1 Tax=Chelativorans sp. M5D2P16 TaxID=3095678 RepID=UPI002ACB02D2|nr:IS110 family transposase [Chelativorans sp. M5D2P16]MDZ5696158.1 IS110 family transposase [Chelativorans sp. M5D2P16]